MWRTTCGCSASSVFFMRSALPGRGDPASVVLSTKGNTACPWQRIRNMGISARPAGSKISKHLADVASALQEQRTGHAPTAVTVVFSEDTLVVTLHNALTPAEKAMAKSPAGAAQVQEFHRQLFANSMDEMRGEITRITG